MENETNYYGEAGLLVEAGTANVQVGYWMAAIVGLTDGTVSFNAEAANGKGQFKGASKIIKACDEAGHAMPQEYKGLLSKALKVLWHADVRLHWVGGTPEVARASAEQVFRALGGVSSAYAALFPADESEMSGWNLIQAVATLLATATKRDITVEAVLEEVLTQCEALLGEGGATQS